MVDIAIDNELVFMVFINQQTPLGGPILTLNFQRGSKWLHHGFSTCGPFSWLCRKNQFDQNEMNWSDMHHVFI